MVVSVNERTGGINQRLLTLISVKRKIELSNLKTEKKKNSAWVQRRWTIDQLKDLKNDCRSSHIRLFSTAVCAWRYILLHKYSLPQDFNRERMKIIKDSAMKTKKQCQEKQIIFSHNTNFFCCFSINQETDTLYRFYLIKNQYCMKNIKRALHI